MELVERAFLALIDPASIHRRVAHPHVVAHFLTGPSQKPPCTDIGAMALGLGEAVIENWLEVTEALARVAGVPVNELRHKAFDGIEPTPPHEVETIVSGAFGATAGEDLGIACADLDAVTEYSRPFLESLTETKIHENAQALYEMTGYGTRAGFLIAAVLRAAHDSELKRTDPKRVAALCDLARHDVLDVWRLFKSVSGTPE